MSYIYYYAIGSAFFLCTTLYFFFSQRRIPTLNNRIYSVMLIAGLLAVIFDAAAAGAQDTALAWPVWSLYLFNGLFILSMHLCLPAFCVYLFAQAGIYENMGRFKRALLFLPFAAVVLLTISSPLWRGGIFYIDSQHIYQFGSTHILLYIVSGIYTFILALFVLRNRSLLRREIRITVLVFLLVLAAAIVIQMLFPRYLLTTSATALALTSIYFAMLSPGENVDTLTQCYSRVALPRLLQRSFSSGGEFSLLMFSIRNLAGIEHTYGADAANAVLEEFSHYLHRAFPRRYIMHTYFTEFAVLEPSRPDRAALDRMAADIPARLLLENASAEIHVDAACLYGREYRDAQQLMNTMDYMIGAELRTGDGSVYIADRSTLAACENEADLGTSINRLIEGGLIELRFRPILNRAGKVAVVEALPFIAEERFFGVTVRMLVHAAEQTGCISALSHEIVRLLSEFFNGGAYERAGRPRILLAVSMAHCMKENAAQEMSSYLTEHGIGPSMLYLSISETESLTAYPSIRRNIQLLHGMGFDFVLDEFGVGFTNMGLLAELPLAGVRTHESLLESALKNDMRKALFAGICEMMADIGLIIICGGVDCAPHHALVNELDIPLRSGPFYSGVLDAEALYALCSQAPAPEKK